MSERKLHRIDLSQFDAAEYTGAYVEIYARRTWAQRLKVQDASTQGIYEFKLALFEQSIARWSFEAPPERERYEALDEFLGDWVYDRIVEWYAKDARSPEQSKSAVAENAVDVTRHPE